MKIPAKHKNSIYTIIGSFLISSSFLLYELYDDYRYAQKNYEFCVSYTKRLKERPLNARVDAKFIQRKGHRYMFDMILGKDGLVYVEGDSKLSEVCQIGDSIAKKENSSIVNIYRDGVLIQSLSFECQNIAFACEEGEEYCQE